MNAPDYVEPTIGWRTWGLIGDGRVFRLSSPYTSRAWQPRVAFVAGCYRRHAAPDEGCACGIYALREVTDAARYARRPLAVLDRVLGSVLLWGRIIECERGWRASHAYPQQLLLPARAATGEVSRDLDEIAAALSVYGVPVLPLVGDPSWVCASPHHGLFPEAA